VKTDTIFYRLFQTFPSFFFELINSSPDVSNFYQFSSVEVKQIAFRIDGIFLPNQPNYPIYFLEVQFQPDNNFYRRFFGEIFLYLSKTDLNNDWRGVVIYPNRQVESQDIAKYLELLQPPRVERIYLDEITTTTKDSTGITTLKLITSETNQAIQIAKPLIERVNNEILDASIRRELLELIERILIYKLPQARREEIEAMFSLSDLKQTRFYQDAKDEGKQEGRLEGLQQEKLNAIPRMLKLGLSIDIIAQSLELSPETVQQEAQKYQQQ
jgi:predicted transposase/invertase (TIGR01784 family)